MKIGTQNQAFFPENILEKFRYIKEMGFDGFEIDGKLLVNHLDEVKAAIKDTGLPVTTACGGYDGWIGDFIEERRLNGLKQIERILEALAEVGGTRHHCACCMRDVHVPPAADGLTAKSRGRSQRGQRLVTLSRQGGGTHRNNRLSGTA